jgi:hypothetical protein
VSLEDAIRDISDSLLALRDEAAMWRLSFFRIPRPKQFSVTLIRERKDGDMQLLTYSATFPAVPENTDVETQVFSVTVDGASSTSEELPASATNAQFEVRQDATVTLSLAYKDDAGNVSAERTQTFVARDTIPPTQPGDFGEVTLISERTVPDA